jgi:hypothetical protein
VDEVHRPGSITRDIVEGIVNADIVIADLTNRNANVFYELGIAHAAGNKTIMVAQKMEDVPFDIANYRVILYEQSIKGSGVFKKKLGTAIDELLKALHRTNNPVQEVLGSGTLGRSRRTPLLKVVDLSELPRPLKAYLQKKKIIYLDQLRDIDLDDLKKTDGLGRTSLGQFVRVLLEHNLYEDAEKLHAFVAENGLRVQKKR